MNRLRATNSVPFANRDIAPTTGTPQYATNGVPGVTPQTIWPAYAYNMVQDEIIAVIAAAGLTPDDTNWSQMLAALQTLFRGQNIAVFTTSGSWTVPSGITKGKATVVGGGAGGAGNSLTQAGGGGGAGGAAIGIYSLTSGAVISVTVGAGGQGGGGGISGTAGGTSSFGSFCSATGGVGGIFSTAAPSGGSPGMGVGGNINYYGGYGTDGSTGSAIYGGCGGASLFGGGGRAANAGAGTAGLAYGSGGGASYGTSVIIGGGSGAAGIVIVEY